MYVLYTSIVRLVHCGDCTLGGRFYCVCFIYSSFLMFIQNALNLQIARRGLVQPGAYLGNDHKISLAYTRHYYMLCKRNSQIKPVKEGFFLPHQPFQNTVLRIGIIWHILLHQLLLTPESYSVGLSDGMIYPDLKILELVGSIEK